MPLILSPHPTMSGLVIILSLLVSLFVMGHVSPELLQQLRVAGPEQSRGLLFFWVTEGLLAFTAVLLVLYAVYARLSNGLGAVGYVGPKRCANLATWAWHEWRFYSGGQQEGFRFLGLEIAVKGARG